MAATEPTPADADAPTTWEFLKRYADELVLASLLVLSFIGIGITDFSTSRGTWYWLVMVPVFGVTCLITQWSHARNKGITRTRLLWTQLLHWGGLLVAIELLYVLVGARGMDSANLGLVIVVMLALTTFLAGVYTGWRFCVVGMFLSVSAVVATYIQASLWAVLFIGAVVATAAILWAKYGTRRADDKS